MGLVHPQPGPGEQAALPSQGGHGRRRHRPDDQHGGPRRPADRVPGGVVRPRQRRTRPKNIKPDITRLRQATYELGDPSDELELPKKGKSARKTSTPPSAASSSAATCSKRRSARASPPRTAWAPVLRLRQSVPEPVRVGVIGTGDEGQRADRRDESQVHRRPGDRRHPPLQRLPGLSRRLLQRRPKARPGLLAVYGWKTEDAARKEVKVYGDYKELIAHAKDDKIEAVIIALPLHLHAPVAIAAMQAGLHVITEKLMGHSVHECKEMARVAKQTKLLLATGHQRHYSILYDNAVEADPRGAAGRAALHPRPVAPRQPARQRQLAAAAARVGQAEATRWPSA